MKFCRAFAALWTLTFWAAAVYGDGGIILARQDTGIFTITLFTSSQPLQTGASDLSAMVQDKASGDVLLDSIVELTVSPVEGGGSSQTTRLTRDQANNRLLQAATINFPHPGQWRLHLQVRRGNDAGSLNTDLTVEAGRSRAAVVWFYVLLPVVMILLFALHQSLKHKATTRFEVKGK
jgi:hypothetical protein